MTVVSMTVPAGVVLWHLWMVGGGHQGCWCLVVEVGEGPSGRSVWLFGEDVLGLHGPLAAIRW